MTESDAHATPKTWREMLENAQLVHSDVADRLETFLEGQQASFYGQSLLLEAAFCILSHDALLVGENADDKRAATLCLLVELLKRLDAAGCRAMSFDQRSMVPGGDA